MPRSAPRRGDRGQGRQQYNTYRVRLRQRSNRQGLVDSLNRPSGNATGIYVLTSSLEPKRIELMREAVPGTKTIGVIVDPGSPDTVQQMKDLSARTG